MYFLAADFERLGLRSGSEAGLLRSWMGPSPLSHLILAGSPPELRKRLELASRRFK